MILLGIDLETTGIDTIRDDILEVAVVLWDTAEAAPLNVFSTLIHPGYRNVDVPLIHNGKYPKGLTPDTVIKFGLNHSYPGGDIWAHLHDEFVTHAAYFVAHNAAFERSFLREDFQANLPWIDTLTDLPIGPGHPSRKLEHLAADFGLPPNPYPHRALFDTLQMMQLLSLFPIDEIIALANSPSVRLIAEVSYDDRQKAKDCGFRWNGEAKVWEKTGKALAFQQETYPFSVKMETQGNVPS